jgi:tetratricopeptide (TPR) repeat protein
MRRIVLLSLFVLALPAAAQNPTELDPDWLKKPYEVDLVVHADPHPLLTNVFVEQFARDLSDSLQQDLRGTAHIRHYVYRETGEPGSHPALRLMQAVTRHGWTELDSAQPMGNSKIHLVRLAYIDGEYEVQSRQVDGDTAVVSPLRKARTSDRQWVNRLAALQVSQDFGLVGEVTQINGQTLRVTLRAGGLGVPETIRMTQGEVMAITVLRRSGNEITASRLPETIAYVTNVDLARGHAIVRLYSRLTNPLAMTRNSLGFRVVKLGTKVVPLRLRVVDQDNSPIAGYSVNLFPGGFENSSSEPLGATDNQGRISSKDPIYHVAFVEVQIAGVGRTQAPIPLLDEQTTTIKILGSRAAEQLDTTKFEYDRWMTRVNDVINTYEIKWAPIQKLFDETKLKEASQQALAIAKWLEEEHAALEKEFERVREAAGTLEQAKPLVANGQAKLKWLKDSYKGIEELVKAETNPSEDLKLLKQGDLAYQQANFDEAIRLYLESLKKNPDQPRLKEKLSRLRNAWRILDDDHKKAREFAMKVWSNKTKKLDWTEIPKALADAQMYFTDLVPRKDYLTGIIILNGNLAQLRTLNAAAEALGSGDDAAEKQATIEKTKKDLAAFEAAVRDFVEKTMAEAG